MKTANLKFVAACVAVTVIIITAVACKSNQIATRDQVQCGRNLKALRISVTQYRDDHNGDFPLTLNESLAHIDVSNINLLRSPATKAKNLVATDRFELLGYCYVNWSKHGTNEPLGDFPLIYDADLQNHGDGINVVCVDGTQIWDRGAEWLKKFTAQHRSAALPIPK